MYTIILVGILILTGFVYKYLDTRNKSLIITMRFVFGMFFAFSSMCIAGVVEIFRQNQCIPGRVFNE
jgi:hypothetical protein